MQALKILAIPNLLSPSFELLLKKPLDLLTAKGMIPGYQFRVSGKASRFDIDAADIVIFQRNCEFRDLASLYYARYKNKFVIYSIDDDLMNTPSDLGGLSLYYNAQFRRRNIETFYKEADCLKATSDELCRRISTLTFKRVHLVEHLPNDDQVFSPVLHSTDGKIRFITVCNYIHYISALLKDVLPAIVNEFKDQVSFTFYGVAPRDIFLKSPHIHYVPPLPFDLFMKDLSARVADAALTPLDINPFTLCKSNLKFREFAARGLAGIYSDMPVYSSSVENGRTGFLVPNQPEAWYGAIKNIIENPKAARGIGLAARKFAEENYTMEKYAHWLNDNVLRPAHNVQALRNDANNVYLRNYYICLLKQIIFKFYNFHVMVRYFFNVVQKEGLACAVKKAISYLKPL